MNCKNVQPKLPLFAEGDLDDATMQSIEAHLISCSRCKVELDDITESQRAVKALRAVPMDADAMAAMRHAVFERLAAERFAPRRRTAITRKLAAGVLAAAGLVVLSSIATLWLSTPRHSAPAVNVAREPHESAVAEEASTNTEPVLVKLVTDNPNVVVYWVSDDTKPAGDRPSA